MKTSRRRLSTSPQLTLTTSSSSSTSSHSISSSIHRGAKNEQSNLVIKQTSILLFRLSKTLYSEIIGFFEFRCRCVVKRVSKDFQRIVKVCGYIVEIPVLIDYEWPNLHFQLQSMESFIIRRFIINPLPPNSTTHYTRQVQKVESLFHDYVRRHSCDLYGFELRSNMLPATIYKEILPHSCPTLKELKITTLGAWPERDVDVYMLCSHLTKLSTLCLSSYSSEIACFMKDNTDVKTTFPSIHTLKLHLHPKYTLNLLKRTPNLHTLVCYDRPILSEHGVHKITHYNRHQFHLQIAKAISSQSVVPLLETLKLEINGSYDVNQIIEWLKDGFGVSFLQSTLKTLRLTLSRESFRLESIPPLVRYTLIECKNLQHLTLVHGDYGEYRVLFRCQAITKSLPHLKSQGIEVGTDLINRVNMLNLVFLSLFHLEQGRPKSIECRIINWNFPNAFFSKYTIMHICGGEEYISALKSVSWCSIRFVGLNDTRFCRYGIYHLEYIQSEIAFHNIDYHCDCPTGKRIRTCECPKGYHNVHPCLLLETRTPSLSHELVKCLHHGLSNDKRDILDYEKENEKDQANLGSGDEQYRYNPNNDPYLSEVDNSDSDRDA